jgi:hypothetical protein
MHRHDYLTRPSNRRPFLGCIIAGRIIQTNVDIHDLTTCISPPQVIRRQHSSSPDLPRNDESD